ncbi:MAG: Protein translocase subunit SecE [Bacteriovoracaceae bacterium]|nr:Protein translocase subunit SecE [Bacteriovoracaceae bacterium]
MDSENRKFTLLSFFVFSCLCAYIFYLILTQIADWMKWGGSHALLGQSWTVVGGGIAALSGLILLITLSTNRKAVSFVDDVFSELRKTTWPSFRTTAASTLVVTVMVGVAALILFMMDYLWGVFFRFIL